MKFNFQFCSSIALHEKTHIDCAHFLVTSHIQILSNLAVYGNLQLRFVIPLPIQLMLQKNSPLCTKKLSVLSQKNTPPNAKKTPKCTKKPLYKPCQNGPPQNQYVPTKTRFFPKKKERKKHACYTCGPLCTKNPTWLPQRSKTSCRSDSPLFWWKCHGIAEKRIVACSTTLAIFRLLLAPFLKFS